MLARKEKNIHQKVSDQLRDALAGRTQRWLSDQTGIAEDKLSNKIRCRTQWKQGDIDLINKVLGTSFKL